MSGSRVTPEEKRAYHREWAAKHPERIKGYYRVWREKHPKKPALTELERFWSKVSKSEGCWEWTGAKYQAGYGLLTRKINGKWRPYYAHRAAYEFLVGPIPAGLQLDHVCRNRGCVNPAHLEPVTRLVNIMRGAAPHAINARKTHCKWGHPFAGDNLAIDLSGNARPKRVCRICARKRCRQSAKRPEAQERAAARSRTSYYKCKAARRSRVKAE